MMQVVAKWLRLPKQIMNSFIDIVPKNMVNLNNIVMMQVVAKWQMLMPLQIVCQQMS